MAAHREQPDARAWDRDALRDPHAQADKAARVEAMFDAIAGTYERVNAVTSFGRDAHWRRRAVAAAGVRATDVALDLCCGTGDMTRALARGLPPPRLILAVDFAAGMLAAGHYRESDSRGSGAASEPAEPLVQVLRADALCLPLADCSVDVITCAFGVRNFRDVQAGLAEMHRVARPGARVVILDFATPDNPLARWAWRLYCERVLPAAAAALSHERVGAYRYLARSIRTFESTEAIRRRLERAGFDEVRVQRMNLGGVALFRAVKKAPEKPAATGRGEQT